MKTKSTGFTTGLLAAALALSTLTGARAQTNAENQSEVFQFPGGSPRDLLQLIEKEYKVDWLSVADIPREMDFVRVPQFRIDFERYQVRGQGQPVPIKTPVEPRLTRIIAFYNRMAEQKPELGKLYVDPEPMMSRKPSVVLLVPDKNSPLQVPEAKIKAFPLKGIHKPKWKDIEQDVAIAQENALRLYDESRARYGPRAVRFEGQINIHESTGLLVAYGSESYIATVESIVAAYQANEHEIPPPGGAPAK